MTTVLRGAFLLAVTAVLTPPASRADDPWGPFRFLVGEWEGGGSGRPGAGKGEFSFATELGGKALVRKGLTEFPTVPGKPKADPHEDLLVIYQDGAKALYLDSEGHEIVYRPSFSADKATLTFLSEGLASAPRFRLSYTKGTKDTLRIKFEIAPPGKAEEFKTYLDGEARRKKPKP